MPYIPNPDKPGEISTLRDAVGSILQCRTRGGGWRMGELERQLNIHAEQMAAAVDSLDQTLDEHYPPVEAGA
jgi:hypothetical protein